MGIHKPQGHPYHCDTAIFVSPVSTLCMHDLVYLVAPLVIKIVVCSLCVKKYLLTFIFYVFLEWQKANPIPMWCFVSHSQWTKSQSQCIQSHFPSPKSGQSHSHFTPSGPSIEIALYSNCFIAVSSCEISV